MFILYCRLRNQPMYSQSNEFALWNNCQCNCLCICFLIFSAIKQSWSTDRRTAQNRETDQIWVFYSCTQTIKFTEPLYVWTHSFILFLYWTHSVSSNLPGGFYSPAALSSLDFTFNRRAGTNQWNQLLPDNVWWDDNLHIQAHGISVGNLCADIHTVITKPAITALWHLQWLKAHYSDD